MRRWTLALMLAAALAATGAASAGPPAFDKAEGAGTVDASPLPPRQFSFSALQRGFGERATGTYVQQWGATVIGDVKCLNALGNTAVFGGVITQSPGLPYGPNVGTLFAVWVVDNGPPGSSPPDLISNLFIYNGLYGIVPPPGFPAICPPLNAGPGYFPLASGDIVVEDESPPGLASTP